MDIQALVAQLVALAGFGALVAAVVNALKFFGIVKDGQAPAYTGALNLAGLVALFALKVFAPAADMANLDGIAGQIAQLLTVAFGLFVQLGGSKAAHEALKGAPLFGFSYSAKA